jgi:hypothetical protein
MIFVGRESRPGKGGARLLGWEGERDIYIYDWVLLLYLKP